MPTLAPTCRPVSSRPYVLASGLLLLAGLLSPGIQAQPTAPPKPVRELSPQAKAFFTPEATALFDYYTIHIQPVVLNQRRLFDPELTAVDRHLLQEYHTKTKQIEADHRARQRLEPPRAPGQQSPSHKRYMWQLMVLPNPADSLARKYAAPLRRHLQVLAPQVAHWQAAIRAIEQQYADDPGSKQDRPRILDLQNATDPVWFLLLPALTEAQLQASKRRDTPLKID